MSIIKSKFIWLVVIFSTVVNLQTTNAQNVFLKGTLSHFSSLVTLQNISDVGAISPVKDEYTFAVNKNGSFNLQLNVLQPTYFKLGRNILYLSPGDSLELFVDYEDPEIGVFYGRGATANMYLRNTPFPKAGSFIVGGERLSATPEETLQNIIQAANERRKQLAVIKGVSPMFKKLEMGRIEADIINSINYTPGYYTYHNKIKDNEIDLFIKNFNKLSLPVIKRSTALLKSPVYMPLVVYRDILKTISEEKNISPAHKHLVNDWLTSYRVKNKMANEKDKEAIKKYKDEIVAIQTPHYKKALLQSMEYMLRFGKGDKAIDFAAIDTSGKAVRLSDLKGKLIYIDLWATWCGPCMEEMPYYDQLREQFKNREDVVFLSLSIDDDNEKWIESVAKRKATGHQ